MYGMPLGWPSYVVPKSGCNPLPAPMDAMIASEFLSTASCEISRVHSAVSGSNRIPWNEEFAPRSGKAAGLAGGPASVSETTATSPAAERRYDNDLYRAFRICRPWLCDILCDLPRFRSLARFPGFG